MTRDHAASVKARLLGKTKAAGDWQDEDPRTGGFRLRRSRCPRTGCSPIAHPHRRCSCSADTSVSARRGRRREGSDHVALGRRNSRMKDFHDVGSLSEALASIRHGAEGGARRMRVIRSGKSSNHALHASAWSSVRQRSPGCLEGSRHVIHHFAELLVQPYGIAAVNPGDDVGATPRNQVFPKSDENG